MATLGTQTGNAYTATITPNANVTSVTVMIAAGAVTAARWYGYAIQHLNIAESSIDRIAPTVSITQPSRIQKMEFMTTITFSEDVTGFDDTDNDVTLGGTACRAHRLVR